jgi:hypothetical protein
MRLPTDIPRAPYPQFSGPSTLVSFRLLCVVIIEAYQGSNIALFVTLNVASADLNRVTFRSKKKLAPVRST